jgi:hypothetical protein
MRRWDWPVQQRVAGSVHPAVQPVAHFGENGFKSGVDGKIVGFVGEAPEWQRLYDRREDYRIGTVPKGVMFLTAGVDVQKDRIEVEVVGWGRGKES